MGIDKTKYWCGVLYPENLIENWQDEIGHIVQVPFAYCVHDADLDGGEDERKVHVHLILVFSNTTTKKHAYSVFSELFAPGRIGCNTIKAIINIRHMYDYLIHDTDDCRKKNKHLYPTECRVLGNNFDIGSFEQLSISEKNDMCKELCNLIMEKGYTNFGDFYLDVVTNFEDTNYFELLKTYSGLFERLTKSNYQKWQFNKCYANETVMLNVETGEVIN